MAHSVRPSITNAPVSPQVDRHDRMVKYSIAMTIRLVCLLLFFLVPGWWRLIPAFGAVILPYVAVIIANVSNSPVSSLLRPVKRELPRQVPVEQDASDEHS